MVMVVQIYSQPFNAGSLPHRWKICLAFSSDTMLQTCQAICLAEQKREYAFGCHWLWLIRIATDHILYLSCCAVFSWWMASMVVTQMHRVWHSREGYLFGPKLCRVVVCLANHLTPSRLSSRNKHLKSLSSTSFKGDAKPGKTCTIASC